ncbi:MAG: YidC/Oxa1 family membrane protein insertase [Firmicutes bacterium]|nr:YidC/Oxa1 family membrane protein insertase [Bacillota bacterium]
MNKKFKVLVLILMVALTTSCTKYIKEDNKSVVYEATGQTLASNILCKPVTEDLYNFYKEHESSMEVKLDDLVECKEYTPTKTAYKGLWETLLVKPIAWLILKLGELITNYGLSVMLMSLFIRALMIPISKKSMAQSENMKKAQPEMARIEKKYGNKTDQASMMAKSQEMMMVYKKYDINPVSGCLTAFIQLPLFFAFLEAINRVPAIFEDHLFGMNLGMTPLVGLSKGNYIYIALIAIIILSTFITFKFTMSQNQGGQADQMKFMMTFMLVMISVASLSLPTAIALYWIVNNVFAIIQNIIVKKSIEKRK